MIEFEGNRRFVGYFLQGGVDDFRSGEIKLFLNLLNADGLVKSTQLLNVLPNNVVGKQIHKMRVFNLI